MRFIPTRIHGVLDYAVGVLLIAAPFLLGFANGGPEMWVPIILGAGAILYSLFTNYELGVVRAIPMPVHLAFDVVAGVFLAASPWLLGYANEVYLPHLLVGLLEIGAGVMTHTVPDDRPRLAGTPAPSTLTR